MERTQVEAKVRQIIVEHLGVEPIAVVDDAYLCPVALATSRAPAPAERNLDDVDLGADSLDVVELVMAFEEEFGIEITDDEGESLNDGKVGTAVDLVAGKVAAKVAA